MTVKYLQRSGPPPGEFPEQASLINYNSLKIYFYILIEYLLNTDKNKKKHYHDGKNISEGAPLRQERSPRRGARRAGVTCTCDLF